MAAFTVEQLNLIEDIRAIRHALHIGLDSFGEIERVREVHTLLAGSGTPVGAELKPLHPTGASDTVGVFARALALLDGMEPARP